MAPVTAPSDRKPLLRRLAASAVRVERHALGPRVHLCGRRIHEYQLGLALVAATPLVSAGPTHPLAAVGAGASGLWLVVKDWPDLFPSTRDRASWRLGLHRLPRADRDRG